MCNLGFGCYPPTQNSLMLKIESYQYRFLHVLIGLFVVRIIQAAVVYFVPFQFDTSSAILIDKYKSEIPKYPGWLLQILNNLTAWDSVYFLKLSMDGITYEHEWVFGPLWWRMMRIFKTSMSFYGIEMDIYDVLVSFIILNNVLIILISYILYHLCLLICEGNLKLIGKLNNKKFAYYTSLIILIQPSGIFSTVSYSETMVQFLSYLGVYLYLSSRGRVTLSNRVRYFLSGTLFTIAFGFRSNSLLYGIIYLTDLLQFRNIKDIFAILITGAQLFIGLALSIYIPYSIYCPERGEWCNSFSKSLVLYAQSHYWDNGFLKYFTIANIPMFVIAAPQLLILGLSINFFKSWVTLKSLTIMSAIYLALQFTTMHVQIVNRVSTFIPLHIWYVSYLYTVNPERGRWILKWWIFWVILQTALFAAFLPPA